MEEKSIRCLRCGSEFTDKEIEFTTGCAFCGSKSIPCAISDDVLLKINWHELHILVVWAENYARMTDEKETLEETLLSTVMIIAQRLQQQFPDKGKLTLFSEIRDLRKFLEESKSGSVISTDLDDDAKLGL